MKELFQTKRKKKNTFAQHTPRPAWMGKITHRELAEVCLRKGLKLSAVKKQIAGELETETKEEYFDRGGKVTRLDYFPGYANEFYERHQWEGEV